MSAFNWIEFRMPCPHCGTEEWIRAQTHVASDYDGDQVGRFQDETYRLGEKMRWWEPPHRAFLSWKNGNRKASGNIAENADYECCYANCLNCKTALYAVIKFVDCVPVETLELGLDEAWPESYYR